MRTTSRPNFISALEDLKLSILQRIKSKFISFFNKRLVDTGLAVRTSEYAFDVGFAGVSSHRRSITKLRAVFLKNLEKASPFVELVKGEVFDSSDSDNFSIVLKPMKVGPEGIEVDPKLWQAQGFRDTIGNLPRDNRVILRTLENSGRTFSAVKVCVKEFGSLRRYVKYMNYLCIKNRVPLKFSLEVDSDFSSQGGKKVTPKIRISVYRWVRNNTAGMTEYLEKVAVGQLTDADFDSSKWEIADLGVLDNCEDMATNPSGADFHMANIFIHLDKGIQLFNTLSRKVEYGFQAFSLRTS